MEKSIKLDKIIIGAGLYGLYAALFAAVRGEKVAVLECDSAPFKRATYINQARVHQGYHYPRSLSTAEKSAGYFRRFNNDFSFAINSSFKKIYATASKLSWSNAKQFKKFCQAAQIPCEEVTAGKYFNKGTVDGAFLTQEFTYDAMILRDYYLEKLADHKDLVNIYYNINLKSIEMNGDSYIVSTSQNEEKIKFSSSFILNATYASTNQLAAMLGYETFKIKYELCEIILVKPNARLNGYGITVMDGPFFSIMPFGKTAYHSLTAVSFTPHTTSYEKVPTFNCQQGIESYCSTQHLGNCNDCPHKPATADPYMSALAHKFLKSEIDFTYKKSLFSMKPILVSSELDDSRPTVIRKLHDSPTFFSVLSGKFNTVYDLDEVLKC